ncbi:Phytoene dehydrogenase-related protein [Prosthecobacter debontii]|uniref:Phytoene dehydrogenase-related protein n=1 Tax=Prosthecobacter debontii TaxID=48467 RepID=A0A1T4YPU0_9BACT|nr:NAD(P)/FAD-dependent oxidoreductase [Prosthecobacter debontii]SKB03746.1 Phytoene dehydrogenase-related protein [Prosthecobacter debontii]
MKRRRFLQATAAVPALLTGSCSRDQELPGRILGASASVGHRLRDFSPAHPLSPSRVIQTDVLIAGGGISGLAAAHQLRKNGVEDFTLLELEPKAGGNSISGHNTISAYPWGAHYVPLPGPELHEVRALFEELGLIQGWDAAGRPLYDEVALCQEPHERLFIHGQWEAGIAPLAGMTPRDREEWAAFEATIRNYQERRAFVLPVDRSPRDADLMELDQLSMAEWMARQGWTSQPLHWYVNYACRDDFGGSLHQVSAWAGIHYFASRNGDAANATAGTVLTWPEGNGYLVNKLSEGLKERLRTGSIVMRMEVRSSQVITDVMDASTGEIIRYQSRTALCAMPRFIAQHIVAGLHALALPYSPWVVTNLTLDELPPSPGVLPAWDNVIYHSDGLGYVNATHQNLMAVPRETVITHYDSLDTGLPAQTRQWMQTQTHRDWAERSLHSLHMAHPDLREHVQQVDVWLWGHGMIRPEPGFIWGNAREQMQQAQPPIFFAHSDMSGMSLFEEAYTRGVQVADAIHAHLG